MPDSIPDTLAEEIAALNGRIAIDPNSGCWLWQGVLHEDGYGIMHIGGKRHYVHRVIYQAFVRPLSYNEHLDHDAHGCPKNCCNPTHLEPVSCRENSLRGNHPLYVLHREKRCKAGHDMSIEANVYRRPGGQARCRICAKRYQQERRERLRSCAV